MTELDGEIMVLPDEQVEGFTEAPWIHKRKATSTTSATRRLPREDRLLHGRVDPGPVDPRSGLLAEVAGNSQHHPPGHHHFKGRDYFFYHNGSRQPPNIGGSFRRSVCIEELHYNQDGTLKRVVQTTEGIEPAE